MSFSVFPALNVGEVDAGIETASPVLGLRPVTGFALYREDALVAGRSARRQASGAARGEEALTLAGEDVALPGAVKAPRREERASAAFRPASCFPIAR